MRLYVNMDFDNDSLISLVQGFDCVYDPQCKEYKSRHARVEAWGSICKSLMGESWEDLSPNEKQRFGKYQNSSHTNFKTLFQILYFAVVAI